MTMFNLAVLLSSLALPAALALAVAPPHASPEFKPKCEGLHGHQNYPNPAQENTYFQCVYGRPIKLWCPSRQLFNPAKGHCEPIQDIDKYPDVHRSKVKCTFHGELLCNPDSMTSFFHCAGITPYLHDCPDGLVFNRNLGVCAYWAPRDGCGFTDCTAGEVYDHDKLACVPVTPDPCRDGNFPDGTYPVPEVGCEFFFRCQGGSQVGDIQKCPDDWIMDPRTLECEYDLSIVCKPCGTKDCSAK